MLSQCTHSLFPLCSGSYAKWISIKAPVLQSQIFAVNQTQLIGINTVKQGCCCCTHVEQMPLSLGEAYVSLSSHWSLELFCNDLAFVKIIQTLHFVLCDLSVLVTKWMKLKNFDRLQLRDHICLECGLETSVYAMYLYTCVQYVLLLTKVTS